MFQQLQQYELSGITKPSKSKRTKKPTKPTKNPFAGMGGYNPKGFGAASAVFGKSAGARTSKTSQPATTSSSRLITLRGQATVPDLIAIEIWDSYEAKAKRAFTSDGWDLLAFEVIKGVFSSSVTVNIRARVGSAFTGENARQKAIQLLSTVYKDVSLVVANDERYTPPAPTTDSAGGGSGGSNAGGKPDDKKEKSWLDTLLESFGNGLGLSTPMMVLGGGIVLLIVLKK